MYIVVFVVFVIATLVVPYAGASQSDDVRRQIQEKKQEAKKQLELEREKVRAQAGQGIEGIKQQIQLQREEFEKKLEAQKEAFKQSMQQKKEELSEKREALQGDLRTRLDSLKDEKKKDLVLRINEQLARVHDRVLDNLTKSLASIEDVLKRVSVRADVLQGQGRDVSAVRSTIVTAQTAIEKARAAIQEQSGKTYVITFDSENALKNVVGKIRSQMERDLKVVRDFVHKAREAVRASVQALHAVGGVLTTPAPSFSPGVSPSPSPTSSVSPLPSMSPTPTVSPSQSVPLSPSPSLTNSPQATPTSTTEL